MIHNDDTYFLNESSNIKINPVLEFKSDPVNCPVIKMDNTYYISASDLRGYMESCLIEDAEEAVDDIVDANSYEGMTDGDTVVVVDKDKDSDIVNDLEESSRIYIVEKSSYSDASNPHREARWYKKFVTKMKSGQADAREIDTRIRLLEDCVSSMKKALNNPKKVDGDRVKYVLKELIPFNAVVRFLKNRDKIAGFSTLLGLVSFLSPSVPIKMGLGTIARCTVRALGYEKMLSEQIKMTEDAIDFLKSKKKELDSSK